MACSLLFLPSKAKGIVTIPTTNISSFSSSSLTSPTTSISFAIRAITGLAPVPVPPPIPAAINNMCVFPDKACLICSSAASAAFFATAGVLPAPKPLPN